MKTVPTHYTAFRCPEDLLKKAKIKASRDRRSLSNYLTLLLDRDTRDVEVPRATAPKKKR